MTPTIFFVGIYRGQVTGVYTNEEKAIKSLEYHCEKIAQWEGCTAFDANGKEIAHYVCRLLDELY